MSFSQQRLAWRLGVALVLAFAGLAFIGICVGSTGFENVWLMWQDPLQTELAQQIVIDIRAPRTIGAYLAGALLGLAGAVAQGLFRNPLADPYLLGR